MLRESSGMVEVAIVLQRALNLGCTKSIVRLVTGDDNGSIDLKRRGARRQSRDEDIPPPSFFSSMQNLFDDFDESSPDHKTQPCQVINFYNVFSL